MIRVTIWMSNYDIISRLEYKWILIKRALYMKVVSGCGLCWESEESKFKALIWRSIRAEVSVRKGEIPHFIAEQHLLMMCLERIKLNRVVWVKSSLREDNVFEVSSISI
jgi:hypothetical protein